MDLDLTIESIQSREDFVNFVYLLQTDLTASPEEWENSDLPRYIAAIAAWTNDMNGYYRNRGEATPIQPTWQMLAQILLAAKYYE